MGASGDVKLMRTNTEEMTIVGNVNVNGTLHGAARNTNETALRICVGHSDHIEWEDYATDHIYQVCV